MNTRDAHYLTLITSPEGMTQRELASMLHRDAGLDEQSLRITLGRTPPCIIGLFPPVPCRAAIESIVARGGDAFACSLSEIEALGATFKIRDLELKHGVLIAHLWRAGTVRIDPKDIQVLIRAKLSERQTKPTPAQSQIAGSRQRTILRHARHHGFAFGGAYGMALTLYAGHDPGAFRPDKSIRISDKLDIHTADRRVFQIDGDKFAFRLLGDLRGRTDNENIDRMCELIAHISPDEIVDPYFSMWIPPVGVDRLRIPSMKINNDDPAFAFYSRWAALMYRHVMGT